MVEAKNQHSSHWWWFDSHNTTNQKRSPWLQSTLAELDEKTKAMLKLIEEDADSFAQRAEMYYRKRPELINMVEEFYRTHRFLAERYDQFKSESGTPRLLTMWASPISVSKCRPEKLMSLSSMEKAYDSYSETYELEESDVEDPDPEEAAQYDKEMETKDVLNASGNSEVKKLREEIERLKEENRAQKEQLMQYDKEMETKDVLNASGNSEVKKLKEEIERLEEENRAQKEQLMQKDEEKREVIRQLSLAVDLLREENVKLRKRLVKESPKRQNGLEFNKLEVFWRRLFNGSAE